MAELRYAWCACGCGVLAITASEGSVEEFAVHHSISHWHVVEICDDASGRLVYVQGPPGGIPSWYVPAHAW